MSLIRIQEAPAIWHAGFIDGLGVVVGAEVHTSGHSQVMEERVDLMRLSLVWFISVYKDTPWWRMGQENDKILLGGGCWTPDAVVRLEREIPLNEDFLRAGWG